MAPHNASMAKRKPLSAWTKLLKRNLASSRRAVKRVPWLPPGVSRPSRPSRKVEGDWIAGVALGAAGARRYRLYRPPDVTLREKLPLLVMLHGCGQDADAFADSTRMNPASTMISAP